MNVTERSALEAAGFTVGSVEDFLDLSPVEVAIIDTRIALSDAIIRFRKVAGISQSVLAKRIGSSQPRVAKIESGDPGVTVDLLLRALFAAGATPADVGAIIAESSAAGLATK